MKPNKPERKLDEIVKKIKNNILSNKIKFFGSDGKFSCISTLEKETDRRSATRIKYLILQKLIQIKELRDYEFFIDKLYGVETVCGQKRSESTSTELNTILEPLSDKPLPKNLDKSAMKEKFKSTLKYYCEVVGIIPSQIQNKDIIRELCSEYESTGDESVLDELFYYVSIERQLYEMKIKQSVFEIAISKRRFRKPPGDTRK